mgnify:FL=1
MDLFDIHNEMKNDCGDAQERDYGGEDYPMGFALKEALQEAKCPCCGNTDPERFERADADLEHEDSHEAYYQADYKFWLECLACDDAQEGDGGWIIAYGSYEVDY